MHWVPIIFDILWVPNMKRFGNCWCQKTSMSLADWPIIHVISWTCRASCLWYPKSQIFPNFSECVCVCVFPLGFYLKKYFSNYLKMCFLCSFPDDVVSHAYWQGTRPAHPCLIQLYHSLCSFLGLLDSLGITSSSLHCSVCAQTWLTY